MRRKEEHRESWNEHIVPEEHQATEIAGEAFASPRFPESAPGPGSITGLTRREFMAGAGAAAAGLLIRYGTGRRDGPDPKDSLLAPSEAHAGPAPTPTLKLEPTSRPVVSRAESGNLAGRGQVFMAHNAHALDKRGRPAVRPVEVMLDHLMLELTGKRTPKDAWAVLFKPHDIVALKPNAFAGDWCAPSAVLMDTLIKKLMEVGVKASNILVFDMWNFRGSRLYAHLRKGPAVCKTHHDWGLHSRVYRIPSGKSLRFNTVMHRATAVINIPVFKDHGTAGVTSALKNMSLGCISNPASHHSNSCTPSVPEIYNLPPIKDKVRLIVADAFRLVYNGGPGGSSSRGYNLPNGSLYVTRDPVALDRIAWDVIDNVRKSKGLPLLMNRGWGRRKSGRPIHVLHAAKIGLGEGNLTSIRLRKKVFS